MKNFYKKLKNITLASLKQKKNELWDAEGVLHNQAFKFDLRPLKNNTKGGSFKTKADKMVFDMKDQFIVVDTEELHQYLKDNNTKVVNLEQLISSLEWNIILPK
jgi:hypothetical protein